MKFKVSETVKGSLVIPHVNGTYRANTEVDLTEEQVRNAEVQSLIKLGLLQGENVGMDQIITEYKNLSGFILNFSWGQHVRPKQNFFIDNKHIGGEEVKNFVKEGLITRIIAEKAKIVTKSSSKPKATNTANKKKANSKINIKEIAKDPESLKDVLANQKIPENVHIHEPKKSNLTEEKVPADIINQDLLDEKDTVQFVDKQQKKEKISKLQKVIQEKNAAGKS